MGIHHNEKTETVDPIHLQTNCDACEIQDTDHNVIHVINRRANAKLCLDEISPEEKGININHYKEEKDMSNMSQKYAQMATNPSPTNSSDAEVLFCEGEPPH